MRKFLIATLALGLMFTVQAWAETDNTGADTSVWHEFGTRELQPCDVYVYGDAMDESGRFSQLGYNVTVGYDLSYANISNYGVVVLPLVGPGTITQYAADIEQYVNNCGGLFIHQPNDYGTVDYAPPGFEFTVTDVWWCEPPDQNTIVDPSHPTMTGLSDIDLPGRFDTVPISTLGSGYSLLAQGVGACANDVAAAAGTYGQGRVFMDVSNLSPYSIDPGSDQYVINVLDWLCSGCGPTAVEEVSWGSIKSIYR
jgi:hypothetical protein